VKGKCVFFFRRCRQRGRDADTLGLRALDPCGESTVRHGKITAGRRLDASARRPGKVDYKVCTKKKSQPFLALDERGLPGSGVGGARFRGGRAGAGVGAGAQGRGGGGDSVRVVRQHLDHRRGRASYFIIASTYAFACGYDLNDFGAPRPWGGM
jgi:hypothetical protein